METFCLPARRRDADRDLDDEIRHRPREIGERDLRLTQRGRHGRGERLAAIARRARRQMHRDQRIGAGDRRGDVALDQLGELGRGRARRLVMPAPPSCQADAVITVLACCWPVALPSGPLISQAMVICILPSGWPWWWLCPAGHKSRGCAPRCWPARRCPAAPSPSRRRDHARSAGRAGHRQHHDAGAVGRRQQRRIRRRPGVVEGMRQWLASGSDQQQGGNTAGNAWRADDSGAVVTAQGRSRRADGRTASRRASQVRRQEKKRSSSRAVSPPRRQSIC